MEPQFGVCEWKIMDRKFSQHGASSYAKKAC